MGLDRPDDRRMSELVTWVLWLAAGFVAFELAMLLVTVTMAAVVAILISRGNATARSTFRCAVTAGDDIGEFVSLAWRANVPVGVWSLFVAQHLVAMLPSLIVPQSVLRRITEIELWLYRVLLPASWLDTLAAASPPDSRCAGPFWLHTFAPDVPTDERLN